MSRASTFPPQLWSVEDEQAVQLFGEAAGACGGRRGDHGYKKGSFEYHAWRAGWDRGREFRGEPHEDRTIYAWEGQALTAEKAAT